MANGCCVNNCHNRSHDRKGKRIPNGVRFFRFPAWKQHNGAQVAELTRRRRRAWVAAVGRSNITFANISRSMFVCSRHFHSGKPAYEFMESDLDWVPSLYLGNTQGKAITSERFACKIKRQRATRGEMDVTGQIAEMNKTALNVQVETQPSNEVPANARLNIYIEHDYASAAPNRADVNRLLEVNLSLRKEIRQLREQTESLMLRQRFGIHRFAASEIDIRFFTRFASYDHFMCFWTLIKPSLSSLFNVRQAQRACLTDSSATRTTHCLQPIDELLLFLNYLATGSKQQDLADRYNLHQSTVSWIITSWSNFLYSLLGSVRIWIPEEQIRKSLPAHFKDYPDTTVILDSTELRCQCQSFCALQSKVFSSNKSHCTLKGLIGIAPHGAVTFVSGLYVGSISDQHITRESGILTLLTPGMAVMVDRGFLIDCSLPCKVYRPAFLSGGTQMSAAEVRETQATAHLRVHVERLIRRVKQHKFFDSEIPPCLFGSISELYTVACLLANYENGPLVKA